ncbi:MAG: tripartite tricarboxylate transporter permease [Alphaproteobacteria bacterium]|nr:tripartite tricarboxylate transporter permease [Alphaproteobacteria bacterium]TAD88380.1 MAG: tripartite tricarboxylate transporter permease [Alphaproteobacteria bacterium]
MQSFSLLLDGLATAITPTNLLLCFVGCLWGTAVGVLPGLGPLAGMALLLPLTYSLDPTGAVIMLAGIFYGAMYGGSTTSILLRIPGEAASIITCIDGHEMARRGRGGAALTIAAFGSFVGGTVSILGLMVAAPLLANAMLAIGPAAEAVLMAMALLVVAAVSSGPAVKTLAMITLGLVFATIGLDQLTAFPRFMFGRLELAEGMSFVALAIGLFGVSELLLSLDDAITERPRTPRLVDLLPTRAEVREAAPATLRGSLIGFAFGIVPGVSHIVSTFASYAVEKRLSRHPERFGQGAVAGLAGPETANNATTGSAMIPLLVLGIPAIPSTAILLSALQIHGVQPGPLMLSEHPGVFWGLVASMYVGNLLLLVLNLPLVGLFVALLRTPMTVLAPAVLLICVIGVFSVSASTFDLWVMVTAGAAGYGLRKFGYDVAPLLLAIVLGDRLEVSVRRALTISDGDYSTFVQGPAAQVFLGIFVLVGALQLGARALGWRRGG